MSDPVCTRCKVRMRVRTSKRVGDTQVRYHRCNCGRTKTDRVPAATVWRRGKSKA